MLDMLKVRILMRWYAFKDSKRDPEEKERIMKQHVEDLNQLIEKILEEHETELQEEEENELL